MFGKQSSIHSQEACQTQNEEATSHKLTSPYLSQIINTVYGELSIFQLNISSHIIDMYLPDILLPFPASIKVTDRMKRDLLYLKSMMAVLHSQVNREMRNLSSIVPEAEFFQQLLPEQTDMARCNIVILGDRIIFARIPRTYRVTYYLLCKHITLADCSSDVRFAGELWHDENANFQLNNNSGTYRPSKILVESAIALFKHLFPFLEVRGVSSEENTRPPTLDRFKSKLKQKIGRS
ncbi:unnamed protein product [Rotaria socialis]|uniref:Uncharacterized protein n=1 Tax=Rotaria socialis TaxID=392032 RepID=A0A817W4A6_9BILA|nr:unnamed protein product [Rotaria socialis]CAF4875936.1 unnamed protein product [Rotaria socialis]